MVRCPYCFLPMWDKKLRAHVQSKCPKRSPSDPPPKRYFAHPIGPLGPPPPQEKLAEPDSLRDISVDSHISWRDDD